MQIGLRLGLPLLAALLFGAAVTVTVISRSAGLPAAPRTPLANPFAAAISGIGVVEPRGEATTITAEVNGVVEQLYATAGGTVAAGAPLARIDDRSYRATLERAAGEVASARAAIDVSDGQVARQDAVIDRARADLVSAVARQAQMGRDAGRSAELLRRQAVSRSLAETREMDVAVADASVQAAGAAVREAAIGRTVLQASLAQARGELLSREAELRTAAIDLQRTTITAPMAARVLQLYVRVGERVTAGGNATPIAVLGALGPPNMRVEIDEREAVRFAPDAVAMARRRGGTEAPFPLRLLRVEPMIQIKRYVADASAERVDTRVMQLLYTTGEDGPPLYTGQQVDVWIEARP